MIAFEPEHSTPRRYREPRGRCPRCDSRSVTHLVIGMPARMEDMDWQQSWVKSIGCVSFGYDRDCGDCGLGWMSGAEQQRERWVELTRSKHD